MCNFKWMALQGIVFFLEYKLIQRHVDSNQNQHDHFYLEINIIVVIQCIGREQDGPSHTRQEKCNPSDWQDVFIERVNIFIKTEQSQYP